MRESGPRLFIMGPGCISSSDRIRILRVSGGLNCHPGENGYETQEGAQIVLLASTAVYGNMQPSLYWYSEHELLSTYDYWDEQNVTKRCVLLANQQTLEIRKTRTI